MDHDIFINDLHKKYKGTFVRLTKGDKTVPAFINEVSGNGYGRLSFSTSQGVSETVRIFEETEGYSIEFVNTEPCLFTDGVCLYLRVNIPKRITTKGLCGQTTKFINLISGDQLNENGAHAMIMRNIKGHIDPEFSYSRNKSCLLSKNIGVAYNESTDTQFLYIMGNCIGQLMDRNTVKVNVTEYSEELLKSISEMLHTVDIRVTT